MQLSPEQFARECAASWIAARVPEFPVINVHALEIAAPATRVWEALGSSRHLAPSWHWRALFAVRGAMGRVFRWDTGIEWHGAQPLRPGNHFAFFRIEHAVPPESASPLTPAELGMSVRNKLTCALFSFVIVPQNHSTLLVCATLARFFGRTGVSYWHVIRPFHDRLVERILRSVARVAARSHPS